MSAPNDGGPEFPRIQHICLNERNDTWGEVFTTPGMTLRDWFAGMALQGLLTQRQEKSDYGMSDEDGGIVYKGMFTTNSRHGSDADEAARDAYEFADEMLAARERKEDA